MLLKPSFPAQTPHMPHSNETAHDDTYSPPVGRQLLLVLVFRVQEDPQIYTAPRKVKTKTKRAPLIRQKKLEPTNAEPKIWGQTNAK